MERKFYTKKLFNILLCIFLISSLLISQDTNYVKRVIDGDTIELDNGERVRLIGIDTPETVHPTKSVQYFGKEASNFTKNLVEGKLVKIEYDVQKRDKYNRLLAYVYLEDGTFINAELVKQGYAQVSTYPPNVKYVHLFTKLQTEARENNRGLWAKNQESSRPQYKDKPTSDEIVYVTRTGTKYHREGCRYLSKSMISISLEDAVKSYSPCSVCNPPVLEQEQFIQKSQENDSITVYITRTGTKYHRAGCRYLSKSCIPISLEQAKGKYSPCSVCNPPK